MKNIPMNFIDLFSGIGGLRLGFEKAGATCVFSCEIDKNAQNTYQLNFKEKPKGDVRQIETKDIPKHDILLAGFPCQSFSIAGKRKGLKDKRGALFYEILRVLKGCKPKAFLLENVTGLRFLDKGAVFLSMQKELNKAGYCVYSQILNTMHYGNLPQTRNRIFIVGFLNQKGIKHYGFSFPQKIPLNTTIQDILSQDKQEEKFYYNRFPIFKVLKKGITNRNSIYQWRRSYIRENKSGVCPTLVATMGTGHNVPLIKDDYGIRKLTPRECARFQGFPNSFQFPDISDCHLYKQIGNSVSIPVVTRIAKNMIKYLKRKGLMGKINKVEPYTPPKITIKKGLYEFKKDSWGTEKYIDTTIIDIQEKKHKNIMITWGKNNEP